MSKRDYYEILGVARDASDPTIKSAYRKLALKYHPDRNPGDAAAEEEFKLAAEAYAIISDPDKRSAYDRFGHAGVSGAGPGGFDPSQFAGFEDIFGSLGDLFGFGGRRQRGGPQRGSDLRYDLEISFEESFTGSETSIQIPREETCETCTGTGAAAGTMPEVCKQCKGAGQVRSQHGFLTVARPCSSCRGTGKIITKPCQACRGAGRIRRERKITVKIPAGIAHGQALRVYGEGEHGSLGGPAGDLHVVVHVQDHEIFHREEDDLYCHLTVNFPTLAMGGTMPVPTMTGDEQVKIPAGTQVGARFKLRGKGMPNVSGRGQGDLYAIARIAIPKKLTKEQKHLLEELAKTMPAETLETGEPGSDDGGADKPFFEKVKDIFG